MTGWGRSAQDSTAAAELDRLEATIASSNDVAIVATLRTARVAIGSDIQMRKRLYSLAESASTHVTEPGQKETCRRLLREIALEIGLPAPVFRDIRVGMPVSTANNIPGWRMSEYVCEVVGVVVSSRGYFPQLGARLQSVAGGELDAMTMLLRETRATAVARMVDEAVARGAGAVVAMQLDVSEMAGTWLEVCAYGTAVLAERI